MSEVIRTVRFEEAEEFQRFLERCYGFWPGFFSDTYPDRAEADEENRRCYLVLERDGKIVSHVGTYPMSIVIGLARVSCGGVGGVATLPEERGKGYMTRLMHESVERMRQQGMALSALWGDQQRYSTFGYETCGVKYVVRVTRRALGWLKIEPARLAEVAPSDPAAAARVGEMHAALPYRVERPRLALQLQRRDARLFLGEDSYLITNKAWGGNMQVREIHSPTGREPELILAMLNIAFASSAAVEVGPGDGGLMERLLPVAPGWEAYPQGMLRIVDWPRLVGDLKPLLAARAPGLEPFAVAVGCRWGEETEWATVDWDGTELDVRPGKDAGEAVELGVRELTAAVVGGPHPQVSRLGALGRLLPVPLHIPSLDHV